MPHGSSRPSVRQELYEDGLLGVSLGAQPTNILVNRKLVADKDTCINRENPLRSVGKRYRLVVGYDHNGTFDKAIPPGNTHGYWTLANNNGFGDIDGATATDGGGFGITSSYLSRSLIQFDLLEAGVTKGDSVASCFLDLTVALTGTCTTDGITLDFHQFHAGVPVGSGEDFPTLTAEAAGHGGTGVGDKNNWDDSATWYEWKNSHLHESFLGVSGGGTISATGPGTGPYGTSDLDSVYGLGSTYDGGIASGATTYTQMYPANPGVYAWDFQGLGATGGRAPFSPTSIASCTGSSDLTALTAWADFSDGATLSNTLQQCDFCNSYCRLPSTYVPAGKIRRGKRVRVDVTKFAMEALKYYGGKMRLLVKVRDDWTYALRDTNKDRNFIVFHSNESLLKPNDISTEPGNPISISNLHVPKGGVGPTIDISYRDLT